MHSAEKYKEPHGVTSQKTAFFIVTAVKTSNLTEQFVARTGDQTAAVRPGTILTELSWLQAVIIQFHSFQFLFIYMVRSNYEVSTGK
jgi:hypothetical protein